MASEGEKAKSFEIGDVVQLKPSGPEMNVHDVNDEGIVCAWFEGKKLRFETFQPRQLREGGPTTINVKFVSAASTESSEQSESPPRSTIP